MCCAAGICLECHMLVEFHSGDAVWQLPYPHHMQLSVPHTTCSSQCIPQVVHNTPSTVSPQTRFATPNGPIWCSLRSPSDAMLSSHRRGQIPSTANALHQTDRDQSSQYPDYQRGSLPAHNGNGVPC